MTPALPDLRDRQTAADATGDRVERAPGLAVAAMASIAAGAIHAGAIGIHAEHPSLARVFVLVAVLQLGWGLVALTRVSTGVAVAGYFVNAAIVAGWVLTRVSGIPWIDGLETAEDPQFTDTVCAVLGAVAAGGALAAALFGRRPLPRARLALPGMAMAALAVPAMFLGASHSHASDGHDHAGSTASAGHADDGHHDDPTSVAAGEDHADDHPHDDAGGGVADEAALTEATWPRPWDPAAGIDLSGVPGVSPEQEQRAAELIEATLRDLPAFADPGFVETLGYRSIGDGRTGFEHYINRSLIDDDKFLDPTAPESLVFQVDATTGAKTLVSAMFIAPTGTPIDDPELTDFAGPLMQWHVHDNLCWTLRDGVPVVVGVTDANGGCPPGSVNAGGQNPMVHVWIAPHACGPFAALEGEGAGQAAVSSELRADQCHHGHDDDHGDDHGDAATVPPEPYDPNRPIDLSGVEGVSPEQQARAENLIAVTLRYLPRYADPAVAEADGFRSIGDGATGYEHYINWSYINDEHELDPLYPESLVYRTEGGRKTLVSAMYMLPDGATLDTVPDVGGRLTQWHIHDNLCFSEDPSVTGQTRVIGLTDANGNCRFGIKLRQNPMLHVWIVPHECGPFAALEGVGAGQIREGEERWCDHAHGAT